MGINAVALMGRLTYEPELKSTQNGTQFLRFCIAVDRNYQPSGQERQADFVDCVAWRQTAEFINRYFHKGDMIAATGEIQTQNFTDKDGNNRKSTEIVARNVSFCESKKNTTEEATEPNLSISKQKSEYDFEEIGSEDDFPF